MAEADAAGTLAVVEKLATQRLDAAAAEYKPGAPSADGKPGRATMVPASFKVMVYELVK